MNRHIRARLRQFAADYQLDLFGAALLLAVCIGLPLALEWFR